MKGLYSLNLEITPLTVLILAMLWNNVEIISTEFRCLNRANCFEYTNRTAINITCPVEDSTVTILGSFNHYMYVNCKDNFIYTNLYTSLEYEFALSLSCVLLPKAFSLETNKLRIQDLPVVIDDRFTTENYFDKGFLKLYNTIKDYENVINRLSNSDINESFKYANKSSLSDVNEAELLMVIYTGLFKTEVELHYLELHKSKFESLDNMMFKNLKKLETLKLYKNNLRQLTANVFSSLENLKELVVSENQLSDISENLFSKNINLEIINLSINNNLTGLHNELFSKLINLKTVLLHNCKLKNLPEHLFSESENLQNISLFKNQLSQLPERLLEGLTHLEAFDISWNKIKYIPEKAFFTLYRLNNLHMANNELEIIPSKLFLNLKNLMNIDISYNNIKFISTQTFISNQKLETIKLSNNKITAIHNKIFVSKYLISTDLSSNQVSSLNFSNLVRSSKQILKVNLTHNHISTLNLENTLDETNAPKTEGAVVVYLNDNPIKCDCNIYHFIKTLYHHNTDSKLPVLVSIEADNLTCASPDRLINFPVRALKPKMLTCPIPSVDWDKCPSQCDCEMNIWEKIMTVNCTARNLSEVPKLDLETIHVINQIEVYLENNLLTSWPGKYMGYENVTKLVLAFNSIREVTWIPHNIEVLELQHNNISRIKDEILLLLYNSSMTYLSLGNNPWSCDCKTAHLNSFLTEKFEEMHIDIANITCWNDGNQLSRLNIHNLCPDYTMLLLYLIIAATVFMFVLAILLVLYHRNEYDIKVWLFAHSMCLWFVTEEEMDRNKKYDAFISYSYKDENFVVKEFVTVLEKQPNPYKLCVHIRDWIAGEFIAKQIVQSVNESRRTIVILSPNFLESVWGKMEFRTAHTKAMSEGTARVIVVLYGEINVDADLDDELKAYIRTNTYVKWGDPWFWNKLRYALPHSQYRIDKTQQINSQLVDALYETTNL